MSRRLRLHVPGGTYYVVQAGTSRDAIFRRPQDYRRFEHLLAAALRRTGSTLHAYCWLPNSIHCAIQIETTAIGRMLQAVTGQYARSMQSERGEHGHFFRHRYRAVLIEPDAHLLSLVRYLHHLPVLQRCARSVQEYAESSDAAYRHAKSRCWLTTRRVARLIDREFGSYEHWITARPSIADVDLFEAGSSCDPRVVGSSEFIAALPRETRAYRTTATLDQAIDTVACRLGLDRELILSRSRERELTLARALITWYAIERRIAPLSEIARRLRRDASTLSVGIRRARARRPDLFDMEALPDLVPLSGPRARVSNGRKNEEIDAAHS